MMQHAFSPVFSGITFLKRKYPDNLIPMKGNTCIQATIAVCCYLLFAFIPASSVAQSPASVLTNRISKSWKMEKMMQGSKATSNDEAMGDFVLIIHPDHTVEQGMYPDGLIKGTWSIDEQKRILSIKDVETAIVYDMKIISVSADKLVLEDQSSTGGLTIYYKAK